MFDEFHYFANICLRSNSNGAAQYSIVRATVLLAYTAFTEPINFSLTIATRPFHCYDTLGPPYQANADRVHLD